MTARRPLALVGPTASGKTEASIPLAVALGAEIVSFDPSLAYRGMDIWTGKPTASQRAAVPHHLVDITDPGAPIGVKAFQRLATEAAGDIARRGHRALLVGASGLYFRAVVDGLEFPGTDPGTRRLLEAEAAAVGAEPLHRRLAAFDPRAAARIEPANARRTVRALEVAAVTGRPFSGFAADWDTFRPEAARVAGVEIDRVALRRRIEGRARERFDGLVAETVRLLDAGHGSFLRSGHLIGYAEAADVLDGTLGRDEAAARIAKRDRALARRQLAWFRRDPRVRWFVAGDGGALEVLDEVLRYLRDDEGNG
jgi:tRNA dimethylallyltransferase